MALYNHIDIALDTIPFNSATTACDALWMGTPLVTVLGDQLAGRQAASILTGLGAADWIARDAKDFVRVVTALALDTDERQHIRWTLREKMLSSELCDGRGLAKVLEKAFVEMLEARPRC